MKNFQFLAVALLALACAFITTSCEKEENIALEQSFDVFNPEQDILNVTGIGTSADAQRKSHIELTKEWWKYVLSFDCSKNPLNFPVLNSTAYQPGPVAFLVGAEDGFATRNIIVKRNQAILVPIIAKLSDYPCSDPSVRPSSGFSFEQFLLSGPDKFIDLATNFKVTLNGRPISITDNNRLTTNLFYVTGKADLTQCTDVCVTGQLQAAVSDGYWLVFSSLPAGKHVLRIHAEILRTGIVIDGYYNITVR